MHDLESEYILSRFKEPKLLSDNGKRQIYMVLDATANRPYIQKVFSKDTSLDIYKQMQDLLPKNIPKIHHVIKEETHNYIIEEYISGTRLDELIGNKGKQDEGQVIAWVLSLCDTLKQLHDANPSIIHRDIKSSNIIITDDGTPKLIDFDISRNYKSEGNTDTRNLGTEYYAAPEQFGFAQTDNRTDIYSVGKLMVLLLTGRQQKLEDGLIDCGSLKPFIEKCCEIDPSRRYQDVSELRKALTRNKSNSIKLITGISAMCVVITACYLGYKHFDRSSNNPPTYGTQEATSTPDIEDVLAQNVFNVPPSHTPLSDSIQIPTQSPIATLEPSSEPTPTLEPTPEPSYTSTPEPAPEPSLTPTPESTPQLGISPTLEPEINITPKFTQLSSLAPTQQGRIELKKYTSVSCPGYILGIFKDSDSIISWSNKTIFLTNINNNKQTEIIVNVDCSILDFSFDSLNYGVSNDGGLFAISRYGVVDVVNVSMGTLVTSFKVSAGSIVITNDNKTLIVANGDEITCYDIANNEIRETHDMARYHPRYTIPLSINPIKNEIAIGNGKLIQIRDIYTWDLIATINTERPSKKLVYSNDAKYLLSYDDWFYTEVFDTENSYQSKATIDPGYIGKAFIPQPYYNKALIGGKLYDINSSYSNTYIIETNLSSRSRFSYDYQFVYDDDGNIYYADSLLNIY